MKISKKGTELYNIWAKKYAAENDRLGGNSENGYFVEGWSIIANSNFVKTPQDLIGLYLFGYGEHIFSIIDEWKECDGLLGTDNVWNGIDMTIDEFEKEMEKYFTEKDILKNSEDDKFQIPYQFNKEREEREI